MGRLQRSEACFKELTREIGQIKISANAGFAIEGSLGLHLTHVKA
jgi:hypothetical protein